MALIAWCEELFVVARADDAHDRAWSAGSGWSAVMSLHKLSAGGGVDYLLRHTCCGDVERAAATPLSSYYTAAGYPPGRWLGAGLAGLGDGNGVGGVVGEVGMERLFALGLDPATGRPLGKNWAVHKTATERVAARIAALPEKLTAADRAAAVLAIEKGEHAKRTPIAVSGFDLTFTVPKSVSVVWALADPATQARIATAHRTAVEDCLRLLETHALFTRVGSGGAAQVAVRGAVAAGFDHWDTRTGDPNLHTHLVLANKVQGVDGRWRSIDAKALYAATVAVSEVYDCLIADALARDTGATWALRSRGARRSPAFEIDGVGDVLLAEFSTRSTQVQTSLRELLDDFRTSRGRTPSRPEMIRLRQLATRKSRPAKQLRALPALLADWRARAQRLLPEPIEQLIARVLRAVPRPVRLDEVDDDHMLRTLAGGVADAVMERRSTWTKWNLIAEAARASKTLRLATGADRLRLVDHVAQLAIDIHCLRLTPPQPTPTVDAFARADGGSAFHRHRAEVFTAPTILDAEARMLAAATATSGPRLDEFAVTRSLAHPSAAVLAADQRAAVHAITGSGHVIDVLVGPAGSGKTTTLRVVREAWEDAFGRGTVIGLAPSATAANELAAALGIPCENTAKWLHETTGPAGRDRTAKIAELRGMRAAAVARGDALAVARIDRLGTDLTRAADRFRLRAGQMLIVDEASLAGTLTLDNLAQQTETAGAKLLLVGDHRQLASVDAGGAFGLLATETRAAELTSLWRFDNAWEAAAGQQLRIGDATCLHTYAAHGRLHEGAAEAMTAGAYAAWDAAIRTGRSALLIAADNATVTDLNSQAHTTRVSDGLVEPGGVRLHDDTTAGIGDTIVTRANRRDLRTSSGAWVRNGDLWTVTARDADGTLTARRVGRTGDLRPSRSVVKLPADYVAEHVELGYATTAHRAQGITVDAAFAILRPGMSRETAYVAMTRGRTDNHAFIATDIPDLSYDGAPAPEQTGRQVMARILATTGAETSATQTLRALQDDATSLARLAPIHETLVQAAQRQRWQRVITGCGLTAEQAEQVLGSAAFGPLVAALRRAEHDGHPMHRVLPALIAVVPLDAHTNDADNDAEPVRDLAAVLHHRVTAWHERATPPPGHRPTPQIGGFIAPAGILGEQTPQDQREAITQLESLMVTRVETLTQQAISCQPRWLRSLGTPPTDPRRRASWTRAVTLIAAYRDRYAVPEYGHPLGDLDVRDPDRRRACRRALAAGRQARAATASRPTQASADVGAARNSPSL